jgi:predicted small lipoprotein YifL
MRGLRGGHLLVCLALFCIVSCGIKGDPVPPQDASEEASR